MNKLVVGVAAMGLAFSQLASATSFDFTGYGSSNNSSSINVLSADGTITATVTSASGGNVGAYDIDGFGVKDGFFNLPGLQNGEILRVDFSETVDIGTLTMRQWEGPDEAILVGYGTGGSLNLSADSCGLCSAETFGVNLTGIDYLTIQGNSGLTVTLLAGLGDVELTSAVPVPAAAWLFGSALIGLAGLGRRK